MEEQYLSTSIKMEEQYLSTPQQVFSVEASQRHLGDLDICDEIAFGNFGIGIPKELSDLNLKFGSLDDCLSFSTDDNNNNYNSNNNNGPSQTSVIVKQETAPCTTYTSLQPASYLAPHSPTGSWISTDDFPEEIGDLDGLYESGIDSDESTGEITLNITVPVVNVEHVEETEDSMDMSEEEKEEDEEEEWSRAESRRGVRTKRRPRRYSSDTDTDSESDPDFDPEDFEEEPTKKKIKLVKKTINTSDYESEEFEAEVTDKRQRRPSKNPIPQQRKKGSKLKISQWIVSLLRDPQYNPSVITWVQEERGKFKISNSTKYAELWGKVKHNPNMNYEKLSRAMRYYYKNKEISIVQGERLTYAFGPSMRDFHAKNRDDPNFELFHSKM